MCVSVCDHSLFKQAALEAQMKTERDKVEGVAGILAAIEETGVAG